MWDFRWHPRQSLDSNRSTGVLRICQDTGKPDNSATGGASSITLTPNPVPTISDYVEDPLNEGQWVALGLVTANGNFLRLIPGSSSGKGKSPGVDITGLFMWTGWVIYDLVALDSNIDGVVDINDVPLGDYDLNVNTPDNRDYNNSGIVDSADLDAWLLYMITLDSTDATYISNQWIFNIADIVEQDQSIVNDGAKLLQVRFYPVATTDFVR